MITPEQFDKLLAMLAKIASRPNTITSMDDWAMLTVMVSMLGGVILLLVGGSMGYILSMINRDRAENRDDHLRLWKSQEECQDDCCPRGRTK